jgi:hypothetical protein
LPPFGSAILLVLVSAETADLLARFERLSSQEQREFAAIVIRRTSESDYGDVTDEELIASAATVFATLDADEDGETR